MTDIVERLREHHRTGMAGMAHADVREAADEIERLRRDKDQLIVISAGEIARRNAEIERLTAANKLLQEELTVLWGPRDDGTVIAVGGEPGASAGKSE